MTGYVVVFPKVAGEMKEKFQLPSPDFPNWRKYLVYNRDSLRGVAFTIRELLGNMVYMCIVVYTCVV